MPGQAERGRLPGPGDLLDRLGEVVRQALERLDGLPDAEDQHQRRVGRQLDVDVVGGL
jgi:hypothetical protein